MSKAVNVDVVSDVICPWCFLGKRRLDRAIALLEGVSVEVRWRPFLLDPTIPREGMSRHDYLAGKFGEARLKTLHDPLIAAARADGVPYRFDAITRTPNSRDAHRLLRWSLANAKQSDMAERLFMAYWNEGKDVGDRKVLAAEAGAIGLDSVEIAGLLDSDKDVAEVEAEIDQAMRIGITGVPTFIIANRYAVVGAQAAEMLVQAIGRVMAEV